MKRNDEVVGHYNPDTGKIEYRSIGRDFVPHEFETEKERREYWVNQFRKRKPLVQSSTGKK